MAQSPDELVLLCTAGGKACALPLVSVQETMRPLPVQPLAGMPDTVLGLSMIRGEALPVLDLGLLLGLPLTAATRLVTLKHGDRRLALRVDAVLGIRALAETSLGALPSLVGEANADVVAALGRLDQQLLFVLQASRLLPDAVLQALDAERVHGEAMGGA